MTSATVMPDRRLIAILPLLPAARKPFCSFGHVWVVLALWVPLPMSTGWSLGNYSDRGNLDQLLGQREFDSAEDRTRRTVLPEVLGMQTAPDH